MLPCVVNSRPQPRQIPPFLSVRPTFPILELISLALFLALAALCSKSVQQSLSNQSLPHSFSEMPGCMGLAHQKSQVRLEVTPSENLTTEDQHERTIHHSSSTNDLPRCQHRTRTGRRCRHAVSSIKAGFCSTHARAHSNRSKQSDSSPPISPLA